MNKRIRFLLRAGTFSAVIALAAPAAAFAEERTKIDEVSLTVESEITAGSYDDDVSVESENTDVYDVRDVEVVNSGKKWSEGDRPRVKITLEVVDDEEYYFASGSADMFSFSDSGAEYVTSSREEDNTVITVTVKLSEVEEGDDSEDDDESDDDEDDDDEDDESYGSKSDWLSSSGVYEAEDKTSDSDDEDDEKETQDEDDDEDDEDDGPGSSETVVAGSSSDEGPGSSSDSSTGSSSSSASATSGGSSVSSASATWDSPQSESGWKSDSTGWWYCNADGTWPKDGWQQISGSWYCFDASGYLRYGWIESGDDWYYCGSDGAMLVNAKTPDGYYVGGSGAWIR